MASNVAGPGDVGHDNPPHDMNDNSCPGRPRFDNSRERTVAARTVRARTPNGRPRDKDAMSSLVENVERIRAGQPGDAEALAAHLDAGPAERFLAHHAAATLAMRDARDHLLDAMRAIGGSDRHVLGQFLAVSKLLGLTGDVARPVSDFGLAAIDRGRWAVGVDALARALRLDETTGDRSLAADVDRCAEISERYERAARTLGRRVTRPRRVPGRTCVALLTTDLSDGSPTAQLLDAWARHASPDAPRLRVYTTEAWAASRPAVALGAAVASPPTHASATAGQSTIARLRAAGVEVWHAQADADAIQTSRMLTERLVRDAVDLLLVDASLADAAAWMTVAGRPVDRQIALLRPGRASGLAGIDTIVDLDDAIWRGDRGVWADRGIAFRSLIQGVDATVESIVGRKSYGIAENACVMLTVSRDPGRSIAPDFARMIARALSENPKAVYLIVGPGECVEQRRIFEAAGVAKRVGYAGERRDVAAFVAMADVYVAEPPESDRDAILTAMQLGRPVAILAGDADRLGHARFVGAPHAVVGNLQTMLDRLSRWLKDPSRRAEVGDALADRSRERFAIATTIARLQELIAETLAGATASSVDVALTQLSKVA